ncbi:peptidyl-prolyl cis-trans isomerase A (cyclophilin A) [Nitrosomonas ureae]|uniref:peptidylprolyl isomerase n=1 Tax=Nitrosomonas ureae TaxID=44577 RepID=A0A285BX86_9PROT|nr:peptidylprolyl isomerase [Nitrosomonas ureae]SNX59705.1 peptidyl-prolyl cis-trans isomerase A (cyclophilin A) [Nitrosomonas ureae]
MRASPILYKTVLFACLCFLSPITHANRVACFTTNMGQFCIELFETQTPVTTANFISYINSGGYTDGIFHRSVPDFVIQGGGFKIIPGTTGESLTAVNPLPPIINEFKISNTRGTVAMAKIGGNPNSATNQWFVNLNDNALNLDNQNGGFTVFGRVIFDGMTVFDAIEELPIRNFGGSFTDTPLKDYDGSSSVSLNNLVRINSVELIDTASVFSHEILSFAVDIGAGNALEVNLRLIQNSPSIVFELDLNNIVALNSKPLNIATFSSIDGQLHIPSAMINPSTILRNVQMQLTDAESFQFTLVSYE